MKLRKITALLLGAAVLTSAAVPMASAEAADFSINGQEEFFAPAEGISATFGEDGALTLTIEDAAVSGSGGHMMWTQVEDPFVNLAETPYLCWEVTGTGNWGLAVRYDENVDDSTCYRMHIARGHEEDGLAPETNSINFLELLKNNDLGLLHNADEITMVAVAMNVFGDAGIPLPLSGCTSALLPSGRAAPDLSVRRPPPRLPPQQRRSPPLPPLPPLLPQRRLPPPLLPPPPPPLRVAATPASSSASSSPSLLWPLPQWALCSI